MCSVSAPKTWMRSSSNTTNRIKIFPNILFYPPFSPLYHSRKVGRADRAMGLLRPGVTRDPGRKGASSELPKEAGRARRKLWVQWTPGLVLTPLISFGPHLPATGSHKRFWFWPHPCASGSVRGPWETLPRGWQTGYLVRIW